MLRVPPIIAPRFLWDDRTILAMDCTRPSSARALILKVITPCAGEVWPRETSIVIYILHVTMIAGLMEYFVSEYKRPLEAKDHVVQLTKNNFKRIINEGELTLVEFYAPW